MFKSVAIVLVMIIVNLAMIFAILSISKRVNTNLKKYFLSKTGDFYNVQTIKEEVENVTGLKDIDNIQQNAIYYSADVKYADYKDDSFKDKYKQVKEEMSFDKNNVILDVIDNCEDDIEKYSDAILKLNQDFDFETIYEISTVPSSDQLKLLFEILNLKQQSFLKEYIDNLNGKEFNVIDFFSFVKDKAKLIDENFYVKTGSRDEDYNQLADNVVTVHDEEIVEGIKVVHKNKMYDYSL